MNLHNYKGFKMMKKTPLKAWSKPVKIIKVDPIKLETWGKPVRIFAKKK